MSRILRRPMFRGGQVESKDDLKVVDQMGIAKLAQGGRVGYAEGGFELYKRTLEGLPEPEKRKRRPLSTGDYLRIASAGMDILGAPSEGSGIGGALRTAAGPLSKLGVGLAGSMDARTAADQEAYRDAMAARDKKAMNIALLDVEMNKPAGTAKTYKDVVVAGMLEEIIPKIYETEKFLETETDPDKISELEIQLEVLQSKRNNFEKSNPISDAAIEIFAKSDAGSYLFDDITTRLFNDDKQNGTGKYKTKKDSQLTIDAYAELRKTLKGMSRVRKAKGGVVEETVMEESISPMTMKTEPEANPISYDQLRARLPKEITDDIVQLMTVSVEALEDFASIATQEDVNNFNKKYNVNLVLPAEA